MCHISPDQWLAPLDGAILECSLTGNFIDTSAEASPEPVHPLVYPELEDGDHLLLHRGVPVVQVRLLLATSRLIIIIIEFQ